MTIVKMLRMRALTLIILIAVIALLSAGFLPEQRLLTLLTVGLLIGLWYLNGTTINDIADIEIDKINLKNAFGRPLANKQTSRKTMIMIATISAVSMLAVSFAINITLGIIALIGVSLNCIYSLPPVKLSHRGIWALVLLPLGYVALPFSMSYALLEKSMDGWTILLLLSLYLCFIGRMALKDYRDVIGDKKFNKRTFLIRYGSNATVAFSSLFFITGSLMGSYIFFRDFRLMSFVIIVHLVSVLYLLQKLKFSEKSYDQQVVIGSVARIATSTLLCIALTLQVSLKTLFPTALLDNLLILGIALFGVITALYFANNPDKTRVKY